MNRRLQWRRTTARYPRDDARAWQPRAVSTCSPSPQWRHRWRHRVLPWLRRGSSLADGSRWSAFTGCFRSGSQTASSALGEKTHEIFLKLVSKVTMHSWSTKAGLPWTRSLFRVSMLFPQRALSDYWIQLCVYFLRLHNLYFTVSSILPLVKKSRCLHLSYVYLAPRFKVCHAVNLRESEVLKSSVFRTKFWG